eukprot:scaffold58727_cov32-Tisochrysis_lutea.AAC.1
MPSSLKFRARTDAVSSHSAKRLALEYVLAQLRGEEIALHLRNDRTQSQEMACQIQFSIFLQRDARIGDGCSIHPFAGVRKLLGGAALNASDACIRVEHLKGRRGRRDAVRKFKSERKWGNARGASQFFSTPHTPKAVIRLAIHRKVSIFDGSNPHCRGHALDKLVGLVTALGLQPLLDVFTCATECFREKVDELHRLT